MSYNLEVDLNLPNDILALVIYFFFTLQVDVLRVVDCIILADGLAIGILPKHLSSDPEWIQIEAFDLLSSSSSRLIQILDVQTAHLNLD